MNFPVSLQNNRLIWLVALVGSFILYGNTLSHDYALDDAIVITQNEFTKQGVQGIGSILTNDSFTGFFGKQKKLVAGGRYRPLSLITFALEYELWGETPGMSHLINLLLYALTVVLLFFTIRQLLQVKFPDLAFPIAWISVLLFMFHPLHTEVVTNIKGRDELMSLLFSLLAFYSLVFTNKTYVWKYILAAVSLFLALMSKENAIAFWFIIPLSTLVLGTNLKRNAFIQFLVLLIPVIVFLVIRQSVLGSFTAPVSHELMNNPFLNATPGEHGATLLYTWLVYLKLLIFPHPLTFDYYPYHVALHHFGQFSVWLMIFVLIALIIVWGISLKKAPIIFIALFGFAATFAPVSNLLFSVGTFMNERFLFMPSAFWSLLLAWALWKLKDKIKESKLQYIAIAVLVFYFIGFYSVKTIARNRAWKNDYTLFTTDVKTSGNSAKSTCSAGGKLWEEAKKLPDGVKQQQLFNQAETYLRKSVQIHPDYADAWLLLGNVLYDSKKAIKESCDCYLKVLSMQSAHENAWKNFDIVLQQSSDRQLQLQIYLKANQIDPNRYLVNYRLGVLYGRYFQQLDKSIAYLIKATEIDDSKAEAFKDLGTAFGISGKKQQAFEAFLQAAKLAPDDSQIYYNLATACFQLGKTDEGNQYLKKAQKLKDTKQ